MTPLHLEDTLLISTKDTGRERFKELHPGAAGSETAITDPFSPDPLRNRTSVLFLANFSINNNLKNKEVLICEIVQKQMARDTLDPFTHKLLS